MQPMKPLSNGLETDAPVAFTATPDGAPSASIKSQLLLSVMLPGTKLVDLAVAASDPARSSSFPPSQDIVMTGEQKLEGSHAFSGGIGRPGCPYAIGTVPFQDWMDGWAQRRAADERSEQPRL